MLLQKRTQDLEELYYDAGIFAFYTPKFIVNNEKLNYQDNFRGFVVPSYRVTDIDYPHDWEHAEKLFKVLQIQN